MQTGSLTELQEQGARVRHEEWKAEFVRRPERQEQGASSISLSVVEDFLKKKEEGQIEEEFGSKVLQRVHNVPSGLNCSEVIRAFPYRACSHLFMEGSERRITIGRRSMPSRSASSGAPSQWGVAAGEGRRPTTGRMSRSSRSASSRINLGPYSFC
ncbi:uncharacterized protein LOC119340130 isoform X2 [Triticum dicoccoides]|uniref:uncharacterized protein LOC119340130 isoform X2 n=1 Tax=Triticum dicoccoides TaxID=85692 RepID=UPI0018916AB0|nr:uncharacterized protein LOC119340130 isoform X2 [Triticum dicoccoides]XP_044433017.1 uncharacterized protein LOC123159255 isoform X2 [Triticum aestivum]